MEPTVGVKKGVGDLAIRGDHVSGREGEFVGFIAIARHRVRIFAHGFRNIWVTEG